MSTTLRAPAAARTPVSRKTTRIITPGMVVSRIATFLILGIAALAIVAPFIFIFRGAISPTDAQLYKLPPSLFVIDPTFANFGKVFAQVPFLRFAGNSIIVAGTITAAQLVTCSGIISEPITTPKRKPLPRNRNRAKA